jgi:hypothetical protein
VVALLGGFDLVQARVGGLGIDWHTNVHSFSGHRIKVALANVIVDFLLRASGLSDLLCD